MDKCSECGNYVCSHLRLPEKPAPKVRKTRKSSVLLLNTELAIPIGITDGTSVGGTRRPRVSQPSSPCLVTRADGSQYVMTTERNRRILRRQNISTAPLPHRTMSADLPAIFAD